VSQDVPFEFTIIIIDGNSTDGTKEIVKNYSEKFGTIRFIEHPSTQPEALNFAIKNHLIKTDLVALIDGDCLAPKDWLKKIVITLKEKQVDAVGGPGLTPPDANMIQRIIGFDLNTRFLSIPEGPIIRHPNMNLLIKRDLLEKIGFDEKYVVGYDTIFCFKLKTKGYRLWYNPDVYVWHYHRSNIIAYIKQQFLYGKYAIRIHHKCKLARKGDNINPKSMIIQPIVFGLFLIMSLLSVVYNIFQYFALITLLFLLLLFIIDVIKAIKINQNIFAASLFLLYIIRLPIWCIGAIIGIVYDIILRRH
jgi:cellulose synthase/poly-beta-1,6-N-acetylglucosamine synthase-like glycosyltransferase